ncbi:MAG: DUF3299 domain-containing protein [Lautropia sp.]
MTIRLRGCPIRSTRATGWAGAGRPAGPARRRGLAELATLAAAVVLPATLAGVYSRPAAAAGREYRIGDRLQVPDEKDGRFSAVDWDALTPPDWDPMKLLDQLKIDQMSDGDRRANQILDTIRKAYDEAPVNPAVDGRSIRIPGFVVPLNMQRRLLKEFLLVPYFGACIHVPPPPANQVIHVSSAEAIAGVRAMDAVWISGTIHVRRKRTIEGNASYGFDLAKIEPYVPPDERRR